MEPNAASAGLPPINTPVQPQPQGGYTAVRPQPTVGVVGRPSHDPAAQEARMTKTRDEARLESLSPKRAKDHRLCVLRTDPSTGRARGKPILTVLSSDVAELLEGNPNPDEALDDFITSKLPDNAPAGTYKCQWYDRAGHVVANPPAWELQVGDPDEEEGDPDGGGEFEDEALPAFTPGMMTQQTSFAQPPPAAPVPPAPPASDLAVVGAAFREERREEGRRNGETMSLVVSMQQQSQQQMTMMMQLQQQQQAAAQQLAAQAEERDRQRRAESRQTMMAMIPLILPMIQQLFSPKDKGPSPEMTVLIEMMKASMTNKGSDAVMFENMMKLNGEMTRQAMTLQASGASATSQMQAEATGLVFKNLMNTLKETMEMKTNPVKEEESTLGSIAKIAGPIIAAVQAQQQQQQQPPQAVPELPAPQPQPQPRRQAIKAAPPAAESAPAPVPRPAKPEKPKPNPAAYSDVARTQSVLKTVRKMSLGGIPANKRWDAIQYIVEWMPAAMLDAVKARNEDAVTQHGTAAAISDGEILQWITDDENQAFLRDVLEDVRLLATGAATETLAEASVIKAGAFVQRRKAAQAAREASENAALAKHTNPDAAPPATPPVSATVVTDASAAIAPPVNADIAPPPADKGGKGGKSGKIPPPAAN